MSEYRAENSNIHVESIRLLRGYVGISVKSLGLLKTFSALLLANVSQDLAVVMATLLHQLGVGYRWT